MIRPLLEDERAAALEIINAAAEAYRGVIPADRWHDPYMSREYFDAEIAAGVRFFAFEDEDAEDAGADSRTILGVMGIQDVADVTLVRHAYVSPAVQRGGIGSALLEHVLSLAESPVLVGTWADAYWAVRFYEKAGFGQVSIAEITRLLQTYWDIPERQVETSVVLADLRALREIIRD